MKNPSRKKRFKSSLISILKWRNIFVIVIAVLISANIISLKKEIAELNQKREKIPYVFFGFMFSGLKDILGDVTYVGYYTDKSLDNKKDAMQFAQAQYKLAPIILDLNNIEHKYIIFDCSTPIIARKKINELQLTPLRQNQFGIVLTRNPNF